MSIFTLLFLNRYCRLCIISKAVDEFHAAVSLAEARRRLEQHASKA